MTVVMPLVFIVVSGTIAILSSLASYLLKIRDRRKYGMVEENLIASKREETLLKIAERNKYIGGLINDLSLKISFFNAKDLELNKKYALFLLLGLLLTILSSFIIMLVSFFPLWYFALLYSLILCAAMFFIIMLVSSYMQARLLKHLPETLRILSSRYSGVFNILKAIQWSMLDFDRGTQKDMLRIYDALCLNDMEKIKETFSLIDRKHSNIHMSLLLELIWNAYYSGGEGEIQDEFEEISDHLLEDIENKKDLSQALVSYSFMHIIFGFAPPIVRMFNSKMLGLDGLEFYLSKPSLFLALAYYGLLVTFALIGIFMERI